MSLSEFRTTLTVSVSTGTKGLPILSCNANKNVNEKRHDS